MNYHGIVTDCSHMPILLKRRTAALLCHLLFSFLLPSSTYGQFTTILNIPPDPNIGNNQRVGSNTQLNLTDGGMIGRFFDAGSQFRPNTNVEVNISGGIIGQRFSAYPGSTVNVRGGEIGLGFSAYTGSIVNISNGAVGERFSVRGGSVNMSGGTIGDSLWFDGGNVIISGGSIGKHSRLTRLFNSSDSELSIFGGSVGEGISVDSGGKLNIAGGSVEGNIYAGSQGTIKFTGGTIGDRIQSVDGSSIRVSGGDFRLDGSPISGGRANLSGSRLLSGTLTDGTPFAFSRLDGDRVFRDTLWLATTALPPVSATHIVLPDDTVPLGIREGQTITVGEGGALADNFNAGRGSTTLVTGGEVGKNFEAVSALVSISGGRIGEYFDAFYGATVNISGGTIGNNFESHIGSIVNISGGEFRLNGMPIDGLSELGDTLPINVANDSVLSGTLVDGTPLAFSSLVGDSFQLGTLALTVATIPSRSPTEIVLPADPAPRGVRDGESLRIEQGGLVGESFSAISGSTVIVAGGQIGNSFESEGTQIAVYDGSIGDDFDALNGTTLNLLGGSIGHEFDVFTSAVVNIFEGSVGDNFTAHIGSTVNKSGGSIGSDFRVEGSVVNLSGGAVGDGLVLHAALDNGQYFPASLNIFGGEFRVDDVAIDFPAGQGNSMELALDFSTLSGTLADGTPFTFIRGNDAEDDLDGGVVTLTAASLPEIQQETIEVTGHSSLLGIRAGQTMEVLEGGILGDDFNAGHDSVLTLKGGKIGNNLEAAGAQVSITGGSIGDDLDLFAGTILNVSGGSIGSDFQAHAGSTVNLFGTQFRHDHTDLTASLARGVPLTVIDGGSLSGILADGSPFYFELYGPDRAGINRGTVLTITLVPEPRCAILLLWAIVCLASIQNRRCCQ